MAIDREKVIKKMESLRDICNAKSDMAVGDGRIAWAGYANAAADALELLKEQEPTVGGWISVKDRLPEEHDSMFAQLYGTSKWNGAMWRTESDRVLVAILFPDGTRTVDKGKLQDGEWRTGVSPVLPQKVTHWAVWPEPPKEVSGE